MDGRTGYRPTEFGRPRDVSHRNEGIRHAGSDIRTHNDGNRRDQIQTTSRDDPDDERRSGRGALNERRCQNAHKETQDGVTRRIDQSRREGFPVELESSAHHADAGQKNVEDQENETHLDPGLYRFLSQVTRAPVWI